MAGGDGKDKKTEVQTEFKFATKPEEKTGWEGFSQFVWNSETGEFLGRTGMSWLKIGVFYIIYYAFLAGFFMGMLLIFYQTLDDKKPRWLNSNGIIGGNPGVGFRPMPNASTDIQSTLIWFRHGNDNGNWKGWKGRLNDYLEPYHNKTFTEAQGKIDCPGSTHPGVNQMCKIDMAQLYQGTCTNKTHYGYETGSPCILLKLNKIYGWVPKPYDKKTLNPTKDEEKEQIKEMPKHIRDKIVENIENNKTEENRKVWIDCQGENPADIENAGTIKYYPENAISHKYFPYENQDGYLSPVLFVQLHEPKQGVMISIECKAWAANIVHDRMERRGLAHFEVMID